MRLAYRLSVFLPLLIFPGCGDDGGESADTCDPPSLECSNASTVVSAQWLDGLAPGTVQLIDTRSLSAYEASRIGAAAHVTPSDVRTTVDGISGQVVDATEAAAVFSAAGVEPGLPVVVYGDLTDTSPARIAWTLEYFGHDDVRFLDGGFGAWTAAGLPIEDGAPATASSTYTISAPVDTLRVDATWVENHLDDPSVVLVDARSQSEFEAGHIPGAVSIDWNLNVADGLFKPLADVESLHTDIDKASTVVAYCQTGSRASVTYLVLRWLGYADVRLYDGSWSEWESLGKPAETGP